MGADEVATGILPALRDVLDADPLLALLWLLSALALAFVLVFGWERLFRR